MKDYVKTNQEILNEWQEEFIKDGGNQDLFCFDGIMFRGEAERDAANNWVHKEGVNDNTLWANAPVRILYLTKDQNTTEDAGAWDIRQESYHNPNSEYKDYILWCKYAFHRKLVRSLYGLIKTKPETFIQYEDIDDSEALKYSDEYPYARINCKKEAGGSNCPNNILKESMEKYSSLLTRQISNLEADIFICCGNQNDNNEILNFLNSHGYNFEWTDKDSYDVHYDSKKNIIAIDTYHLSSRHGNIAHYNDIVFTYYEFLKKHPDLKKTHR